MKKLAFIISVFFVGITNGQSDFILTIDNKSYDVSLDEQKDYTINGKKVSIVVKEKDTLVFKNDYYSFKRLKENSISKTVIDEGVEQMMMMTATGTGVIVQKYDTLDPSMLQEMMLKEVTKESINYGYKMQRKDYERTLSSGQVLNILAAELTYKGDTEVYEILTFSTKDEGILIMTMNTNTSDDVNSSGSDMIKLMWNSLKL